MAASRRPSPALPRAALARALQVSPRYPRVPRVRSVLLRLTRRAHRSRLTPRPRQPGRPGEAWMDSTRSEVLLIRDRGATVCSRGATRARLGVVSAGSSKKSTRSLSALRTYATPAGKFAVTARRRLVPWSWGFGGPPPSPPGFRITPPGWRTRPSSRHAATSGPPPGTPRGRLPLPLAGRKPVTSGTRRLAIAIRDPILAINPPSYGPPLLARPVRRAARPIRRGAIRLRPPPGRPPPGPPGVHRCAAWTAWMRRPGTPITVRRLVLRAAGVLRATGLRRNQPPGREASRHGSPDGNFSPVRHRLVHLLRDGAASGPQPPSWTSARVHCPASPPGYPPGARPAAGRAGAPPAYSPRQASGGTSLRRRATLLRAAAFRTAAAGPSAARALDALPRLLPDHSEASGMAFARPTAVGPDGRRAFMASPG
jgi:hypothetical protein